MNLCCLVPHLRHAFSVVVAIVTSTLFLATAFAQRDLQDIPVPDTDAEGAQMKLGDGSAVNLFAAEPQITKPIQINFDSVGNLWVASSETYPQIKPGQVANDKIVVLRDTNGDGTADKHTVFADGLLIPTGVLPDGPDAAYVAESTRLLYLQDTDGDGKADKRRVVFSGFGTEDTHHLVHTLRWGPDGCVYFNQSIYIHSHIETAYGTRRLDGGGIWRYRPTTGELDVMCKGFINPWGHVFDPVGESFVTDGAYFDGINYTFPDAVFVTSPGATRWLNGMNPGSPKHCGLEMVSGNHAPPAWAGDLLTNDFRSHRVCRFTVQPNSSTYLSRQQPEVMTTEHVAFRPIDVRMGPDGAIYVADWYNPIIQHGEVDFRDERRDRRHGRIWRISFPERQLETRPNYAEASVSELFELLSSDALWVRQFARQELWRRCESNPDEVLQSIRRWANQASSDRDQRMLEALWVSEAMQKPVFINRNRRVGEAIDRGFAGGRTMLRSLWRSRSYLTSDEAGEVNEFVLSLSECDDPKIRLEVAICAGQIDSQAATKALVKIAGLPIDDATDFVLWQSFRSQDERSDPGTSVMSGVDWTDRTEQLAYVVTAIGTPQAAQIGLDAIADVKQPGSPDELIRAVAAAGNAEQLGQLLGAALASDSAATAIDQLVSRTAKDKTVPKSAASLIGAAIDRGVLTSGNRATVVAIARSIAAWKIGSAEPALVAAIESNSKATDQDNSHAELTGELAAALAALPSESAKQAVMNLTKSDSPGVSGGAVAGLVAARPYGAVGPLVRFLTSGKDDARAVDLVAKLMSTKSMPGKLATAIGKVELQPKVAELLLRQVRSAGGNEGLENAVRRAGKLSDASWKLTPELSKRLQTLVAESGSPVRGEKIYRRENLQCVNCHGIGPGGGVVGPNLISLGGSSQVDYIIESMVAPNARLKEGYSTLKILTDEGRVVSGIQIGKTATTIRLRTADGTETDIEIDAIETEAPGQSLMPTGLIDSLTEGELVDLIAFLSHLGRTPEYTVSTQPIVRGFEMMIYSNEANRRLNRTSTDTAASDDPLMKWKPMTTDVAGEIRITELDQFKQHRTTPLTSFVRFEVQVPDNGVGGISVPTEGVDAWVGGKPTPIWKLKENSLSSGKHTIVLAFDRSVVQKPIQIMTTGSASPVQ